MVSILLLYPLVWFQHFYFLACCLLFSSTFRGKLGPILFTLSLEANRVNIYFLPHQPLATNFSIPYAVAFIWYICWSLQGHLLSTLILFYFSINLLHLDFRQFFIKEFNSNLCTIDEFFKVPFSCQKRYHLFFVPSLLEFRQILFNLFVDLLNIPIFSLNHIINCIPAHF